MVAVVRPPRSKYVGTEVAIVYHAYGKALISAREKNGFWVKLQEEAEFHRYKRTLKGGNAARRTLAGSNGKES